MRSRGRTSSAEAGRQKWAATETSDLGARSSPLLQSDARRSGLNYCPSEEREKVIAFVVGTLVSESGIKSEKRF